MALVLPRVRAMDATFAITGGGTVTAIRDLKFKATQATFEASAADATYNQKVLGRKNLTGTYSMWLGTGGIAPALGATITVLSVSVGADEVTPPTIDDATVYGALKVTEVGHSFQDSPFVIDVSFEGGFI